MKKKRNFLTIISSLFGVAAICGLSLFSLLDHKKESQKVEALSIQNISSHTNSGYFNKSINNIGRTCYYNYTIDYNKYLDGSIEKFGLHLVFDFYIYIENNNNPYHEYFVYDGGSTDRFRIDLTTTYFMDFEPTLYYELGIKSLVFSSTLDSGIYTNHLDLFWLSISCYENDEGGALISLDGIKYSSPCVATDDEKVIENVDLTNYSLNFNIADFDNYAFDEVQSNYDLGFSDGYSTGFDDGYMSGSSNGYSSGYEQGKTDQSLYDETLIANAYQNGYSTGYNEGLSVDSTVAGIFSGILQVAMVPVNFFLAIFNFEILNINLSAFIRAIFTVVLTIIVMKTVLGKGGGGNDN